MGSEMCIRDRLNRLKFVNFMKNSYCRTPPKLPGAKYRENTCLVYVARWLLLQETLNIGKISCRIHLYLLNRLRFVNCMKNSSCRTPPKLPGAKYRENTYLVCATHWLLSKESHAA